MLEKKNNLYYCTGNNIKLIYCDETRSIVVQVVNDSEVNASSEYVLVDLFTGEVIDDHFGILQHYQIDNSTDAFWRMKINSNHNFFSTFSFDVDITEIATLTRIGQ